jgi:hypothetical protein
MTDDRPLMPLYRQRLTWVMRPNIDARWPSGVLELRPVRIR